MSNVHKNQTISFRPSPYERKEIEARIKASGLPTPSTETTVPIPKERALYWQFHLKHNHLIRTLCPDLSMMHLHDLSGDR